MTPPPRGKNNHKHWSVGMSCIMLGAGDRTASEPIHCLKAEPEPEPSPNAQAKTIRQVSKNIPGQLADWRASQIIALER